MRRVPPPCLQFGSLYPLLSPLLPPHVNPSPPCGISIRNKVLLLYRQRKF